MNTIPVLANFLPVILAVFGVLVLLVIGLIFVNFLGLWIQAKAVLLTIVWSGVVSLVAFKLVDLTIGLRVTEEEEREGLDISSHGETAYHS